MVAVLKKPKGQCTTLEKILQFRVKSIAVAYCVVELGRLKKEEEKKEFDPCRFAALENLALLSSARLAAATYSYTSSGSPQIRPCMSLVLLYMTYSNDTSGLVS